MEWMRQTLTHDYAARSSQQTATTTTTKCYNSKMYQLFWFDATQVAEIVHVCVCVCANKKTEEATTTTARKRRRREEIKKKIIIAILVWNVDQSMDIDMTTIHNRCPRKMEIEMEALRVVAGPGMPANTYNCRWKSQERTQCDRRRWSQRCDMWHSIRIDNRQCQWRQRQLRRRDIHASTQNRSVSFVYICKRKREKEREVERMITSTTSTAHYFNSLSASTINHYGEHTK